MRIATHRGSRAGLRHLFELADDSAQHIDAALEAGVVLTAIVGKQAIGHVQVVEAADPSTAEITSLAVLPAHQRAGVGRALAGAAIARERDLGRTTLLVATAAADTGAPRFYQRLGFRMLRVERDAFTPAEGYPAGILVDGIPLRDRVWFDLRLDAPARSAASGSLG
jgi:ribosomal protein S18 acetylase RimI-like enzyme